MVKEVFVHIDMSDASTRIIGNTDEFFGAILDSFPQLDEHIQSIIDMAVGSRVYLQRL